MRAIRSFRGAWCATALALGLLAGPVLGQTDVTDVVLKSRAIPILASGASNNFSSSVTIPASTTPGSYSILALADATGAVAETSEGNNITSKAITITP